MTFDDTTMADRVGRYVLRRVLGRGGMGVVYEAVDPELRRDVAIKVLRTSLGGESMRLLHEAQAMAKVSHPNVVGVHDVGRDGDRIFIVMDLVKGGSLRRWLACEPRSTAEIVSAFAQVAEGLRAAHEAGLVHRDFKAENVFVDEEGRVLVGDFGLAISGESQGRSASEGTLATMAPEQRRGESVDARSDQYSYCLVFDGALAEAAAGKDRVPRWLKKILARGMSELPADRYPSMSALVEALERGKRRARRWSMAAFGIVLGCVGLVAATFARERRPVHPLCEGESAAASVWNADASRRIEGAFDTTGSPLAPSAWERTRATLDTYGRTWTEARARACTSPTQGSASDGPRRCLAGRLELFRAVAGTLEHADAPMLEQVPSMLHLLPDVGACEDARETAQSVEPPSNKARVVDAVRTELARAAATIAAGRYRRGLELAEAASRSARATEFLPVEAEAHLLVGTAYGRLGQTLDAERALEHAVSAASASGAIPVTVRAWVQLMHFVGFEGKRHEDGFRWSEYAKAALDTMPPAYDVAVERMAWHRAMLLDAKRYGEALALAREELALVELKLGPNHPSAAHALDGIAGGLVGQCRPADAMVPQEKACALLASELGDGHPQLALCLGNLASLHAALGDHTRALALKRKALAMFSSLPGHPNHVAMAQRNLVRSLLELGSLDEAAEELAVASSLSHEASDETTIFLLRGEWKRRRGELESAREDFETAVRRTTDASPARRIDPLLMLAETERGLRRWASASVHAGDALELAVSAFGDASCRLVEPLQTKAAVLLDMDQRTAALPLAEKAAALLVDAQVDPRMRSMVDDVLTRARAR